ncbi:MAG: adenylylsulfate kinase [Epulopiscium sp. Nele67-Bin005]|nr:MAG: adenylylsulfate kinase [Epulopiscium sp. Nele67-Bin005]
MKNWTAPKIEGEIPCGDMPKDKVTIYPNHISKANAVFPRLLEEIELVGHDKVVVGICGGSGVGKSGVASVIAYYLNEMGIGAYTLSGDNYPHKIPLYNDAERIKVYRTSGIEAMLADGNFSEENFKVLQKLQIENDDANTKYINEFEWFKSYFDGGKQGLINYLGTNNEIDFDKLSLIIANYKEDSPTIWLKRMGRELHELWYEQVDFSQIKVLIVEWTHSNSDFLCGVDIPILLNSTPAETLAHRIARNRDNQTDSPFATLVLGIEQQKLFKQSKKAKIIVSKNDVLLTHNEYLEMMEGIEND